VTGLLDESVLAFVRSYASPLSVPQPGINLPPDSFIDQNMNAASEADDLENLLLKAIEFNEGTINRSSFIKEVYRVVCAESVEFDSFQ